MYVQPASGDPADYGLGIWGTVAMIGGTLVTRWIAGSGDKMSDAVYYPDSMAGVIHCPGPYNVNAVLVGIENLPYSGEGGRIRSGIRNLFASNDWWSKMGVPRTPLQQAGALVAWAHGGHDCQRGGAGLIANDLVVSILELETARRATFQGQVSTVGTAVANVFGPLPEVVPGVPTAALLVGAGALAFFILRS